MCKDLPEKFVVEFQDKINWRCLCMSQAISEYLIRQFADRVDWDLVCEYQDLSEKFILEFHDKVNWKKLCFINSSLKNLFKTKTALNKQWNVNINLLILKTILFARTVH